MTQNNGMNSTESVGFKVVTMGRDEIDNRSPSNLRPLTLAKLHEWIDAQPLDVRMKEQLKKMAGSYPQQALGSWKKNYRKHLAKAQNFLKNKKANVELEGVSSISEKKSTVETDDFQMPLSNEFDADWNESFGGAFKTGIRSVDEVDTEADASEEF